MTSPSTAHSLLGPLALLVPSIGKPVERALTASGSGNPPPSAPAAPPPAPPAMQPGAKPTRKTSQQSFFGGAAMAQQAGLGSAQGKTLIGA